MDFQRGTEVWQEVDSHFPKVGRDREPTPKKAFLIRDFRIGGTQDCTRCEFTRGVYPACLAKRINT